MAHGIAAIICVCVWCIVLLLLKPSSAIEEVKLGNYPIETFDIGSGTRGYSQLLVNLRNRFKVTTACDMPVTRENLPAGSEYVLVDLKASTTQFVTVALQVNNLYLVAYRVGGQTDGVFLNEPNVRDARSKLFSKTQTQRTLDYDSNYANIQKVGGSRKDLALGLQELRKKIVAFYDTQKPVTAAGEAQFLLTAIQMVSEATRFKYIENLVVKSGTSASFKPDDTMIDFETSWSSISEAVHKSNAQVPNQCISISPSIKVGDKTLILISDIKKDVSLLMYKKSNKANGLVDIAGDVGDLEKTFFEDLIM